MLPGDTGTGEAMCRGVCWVRWASHSARGPGLLPVPPAGRAPSGLGAAGPASRALRPPLPAWDNGGTGTKLPGTVPRQPGSLRAGSGRGRGGLLFTNAAVPSGCRGFASSVGAVSHLLNSK